MNRQFQNFNNDTFLDNQNAFSRNMVIRPGTQNDSLGYMERPMNQSQFDYSKNQDNSSISKPIYNPNVMAKTNYLEDSRKYSTPKKEIGILFYSNNCSFCKTFMAKLYKSNLNDSIRKICVDNGDVKIPQYVTSVPTLIVKGINRPLVGEQTNTWLDSATSSPNTNTTNNSELLSYSFNGKDNYTFIGDIDDASVCNSLAEWNKDYYINAPLDADEKNKKNTYQNDSTSIKQNMDINRMRAERDSIIGQKQVPRNTNIDPEKFNKMFLKQQQQFKQNIRNI